MLVRGARLHQRDQLALPGTQGMEPGVLPIQNEVSALYGDINKAGVAFQ